MTFDLRFYALLPAEGEREIIVQAVGDDVVASHVVTYEYGREQDPLALLAQYGWRVREGDAMASGLRVEPGNVEGIIAGVTQARRVAQQRAEHADRGWRLMIQHAALHELGTLAGIARAASVDVEQVERIRDSR